VAAAGTAARLCPGTYSNAPTATEASDRSLIASGPERAACKRFVGSSEREQLLLMHLPQVRLVAESLRVRLRFAMEFEDLVSYGVIGLIKAIERFDPGRGVLLKTYAEHRIRGAILDGARAMDWLPRGARQRERLAQRSALAADDLQNAAAPGVHAHRPRARRVNEYAGGHIEFIQAGADLAAFELISQQAGLRGLLGKIGDDPEMEFERAEMRTMLADAVSRLPERHRFVLELYYARELSMKSIAQMLRIHESRVSQLHAAAVKRLRSALAPGEEKRLQRTAKAGNQPQPAKASKYRVTASQSSRVSTPMVSAAVSAT
jgi:RNA polymerase sigma factor for flagellar operon FliA